MISSACFSFRWSCAFSRLSCLFSWAALLSRFFRGGIESALRRVVKAHSLRDLDADITLREKFDNEIQYDLTHGVNHEERFGLEFVGVRTFNWRGHAEDPTGQVRDARVGEQ